MNKIDLDAIIKENFGCEATFGVHHMKIVMREAIHQALVLASRNAKSFCEEVYQNHEYHYIYTLDKKSILDVEKLIM